MMNRKMLSILIVAVMMAVAIPAAVSDSSDSASSDNVRTATYVSGDDWYRTLEKYTTAVEPSGKYAFIDEVEEKDKEFDKCVAENRVDDYKNSAWVPNKEYYLYKNGEKSPLECSKSFHRESQETLISVNAGTCHMKIESIDSHNAVNLVRATSAGVITNIWSNISVGQEGDLTFDSFTTIWFETTGSATVTYRLTGSNVPEEYIPTESVTIGSIDGWYRYTIKDAGTYWFEEHQIVFIKDSEDEKRFLSEVVDANKYYDIEEDSGNRYNALERCASVECKSAVNVYILSKEVSPTCSDTIWIPKDSHSRSGKDYGFERVSEASTCFYAMADSSFKFAVGGYNTSEYVLYMIYEEGNSWTYAYLAPNILYEVNNSTNSKSYYIASYYVGAGDPDSLCTEIKLHTEGLEKPADDNIAYIVIGAFVGVGVLVFISMFAAHRKPRWAKSSADRMPKKKEKKEKKEEPASEQENRQQDVPPADSTPKEEPPKSEASSENEEVPKKKGFFSRKSKEE